MTERPTLFSAPIVVLDTETTGFPSDPWSGVVEIAAVILDEEGNQGDTFERLCRPAVLDGRAERALEINHISRAMLADAISERDAAAEFGVWLEAHGAGYVTAFNVAFDRPMLDRMFVGLPPFPSRWASCIMERSMAIMGPAGVLRDANPRHPAYDPSRPWLWPKLVHAAEFFGVTAQGDLHRALTDARLAAGVAAEIRRRALGGGGRA